MSKLSVILTGLVLGPLVGVASTGTAHAQHEVQAYLSQGGLDFIAEEAPGYVPSVVEAPTFSKPIGCMEFEQRDTSQHQY